MANNGQQRLKKQVSNGCHVSIQRVFNGYLLKTRSVAVPLPLGHFGRMEHLCSVLPVLLCWEEFLKLCVCRVLINQSPNQARGSCLRPGNGYPIIRWSADGTQGTCAPWLPHRLNLSDGNPTKWVCHVSPAGSIFPFKVVGLEDFRPPSLLPVQSWLCL